MLGVLDGKLCVMSHITHDDIEVWMMNEYGMAESWIKHQLFSQFISDRSLYGLMDYNEILFDPRYRHLALYDSIVAKVKACSLLRNAYYGHTKLVKYVNSLVWVGPTEKKSAIAASVKFENSRLYI